MKPTIPHILDLSSDDWAATLAAWGQPKFRAPQIEKWLYQQQIANPDDMTNLSKALRERLCDAFNVSLPEVVDRLDSDDGTTKLLLRSHRHHLIETVVMRYENRTSLCVSSQVGCKLACSFCQTGKLGFFRHLSTAEILSQQLIANQILAEEGRKVSHVVFMGMGEPFDNYEHTIKAANRMISESGFGLSARHVTLSTSGIVPKIEQLAKDSRAALAVSLHAASDELRTKLMPINRRYPLAKLKEALLNYQKQTGRKITIEYILIRDENCSIKHAKDLVRFIHGLRAKVNLIPFNAHPGLPYERPGDQEVRDFQAYLAQRSIPAPVRYSKGLEVSAACGQLAAKSMTNLASAPARQHLASLISREAGRQDPIRQS